MPDAKDEEGDMQMSAWRHERLSEHAPATFFFLLLWKLDPQSNPGILSARWKHIGRLSDTNTNVRRASRVATRIVWGGNARRLVENRWRCGFRLIFINCANACGLWRTGENAQEAKVLLRKKWSWRLVLLPCWGALPNVAHHALERLGGVPESADATVPTAFVWRRLAVSLWPSNKTQKTQGNTVFTHSHTTETCVRPVPATAAQLVQQQRLFMPLMVVETKTSYPPCTVMRARPASNAELQTSYRASLSQRCSQAAPLPGRTLLIAHFKGM